MDKKKELKLQYKLTPRPMGVFQIKNNSNGKVLIGKAFDLNGKINGQCFQLRMGVHRNQELQHDWNQLGEAVFSFDILETIKPKEDITHDYKPEIEALEEKWLNLLQPYGDKGYHRS